MWFLFGKSPTISAREIASRGRPAFRAGSGVIEPLMKVIHKIFVAAFEGGEHHGIVD